MLSHLKKTLKTVALQNVENICVQDCCGGGSITVHASGQTAEKYGSILGTLEPSRTNEKLRGLPVYRNYGTHGPGAAIMVHKVCDVWSTPHIPQEEWHMAFDFEPGDQFIYSHSSVGTSCPTSAKWGRHSEVSSTSFRSSFRDLDDITVKCSTDGQGPLPTGGELFCINSIASLVKNFKRILYPT